MMTTDRGHTMTDDYQAPIPRDMRVAAQMVEMLRPLTVAERDRVIGYVVSWKCCSAPQEDRGLATEPER